MKRALVLSGGGCKGAFAVGAVDYLVNKASLDFRLFFGSSVGALNAAVLGQSSNYEELTEKVMRLKKIWLDIKGSQSVYKKSIFGILKLLFGNSLYKPNGLYQLLMHNLDIDKLFTSASVVKVPAVALETGQLFYADTRQHELKNRYISYILASASMPLFFPPVFIDNKHWYDGGLRDITPLGEVFRENPDEIVVVITYPISSDLTPILATVEPNGALRTVLRTLEIIISEIGANDLQLAREINRYYCDDPNRKCAPLKIISPRIPLGGEHSLDFDPKRIRENMRLGYESARNSINIIPVTARKRRNIISSLE
jgi:NTE family protein